MKKSIAMFIAVSITSGIAFTPNNSCGAPVTIVVTDQDNADAILEKITILTNVYQEKKRREALERQRKVDVSRKVNKPKKINGFLGLAAALLSSPEKKTSKPTSSSILKADSKEVLDKLLVLVKEDIRNRITYAMTGYLYKVLQISARGNATQAKKKKEIDDAINKMIINFADTVVSKRSKYNNKIWCSTIARMTFDGKTQSKRFKYSAERTKQGEIRVFIIIR